MDSSSSLMYERRWIILVTVIIGTFLGRLDQTIVNLALPKIINDFGITVSAAGWIATAYILANAVFVPIWGKLGDTIGRKLVYIIGFLVFILGSVLAGLSWNLGSMIVFRIIQAIASSADYPTAMAILTITFPAGKERGQALGLWSSSFAAAAVFGPLIGGPLIDTFGWRSVFLINLPVGIVGLVMASRYINESREAARSKLFDWWGAITLGAALFSLVLVLDQGITWGWTSWQSLTSYAAILIFTAIFIRLEQHHPEPMVDLKFFRNNVFVNTLINNFIVFMGMMGSMFLIPIFAQTFLGLNATQTGYLFIPMAAALMLAAPLGGSLIGKVRAHWIIMASTFVAAVGLYFMSWLDPRSTIWDIIFPLALMAFGMGFGMAQRTNIIASVVPQAEIGVASSILALARNIAGAFGIAIFGTMLTYFTEDNVISISRFSRLFSHSATVVHQYTGLIILKAQVDAYDSVLFLAALLVAIGAVLAIFIRVKHEVQLTEHLIVE